jgi:hypothetical protein
MKGGVLYSFKNRKRLALARRVQKRIQAGDIYRFIRERDEIEEQLNKKEE